MSLLVLLRHGQSLTNSGVPITNEHDNILTHKGAMESITAGLEFRMANPDVQFKKVFCSPYPRAVQTGLNFLSSSKNDPVEIDYRDQLVERKFGFDDFYSLPELVKKFGQETVDSWDSDPDARSGDERGETMRQVWTRVIPVLTKEVLPQVRKGETTLLVAHFYILKVIQAYLEHNDIQQIGRFEPKNALPYIYKL